MVNLKRCLDGRKYTLVQGQDFDGEQSQIRQALYRAARKAGVKIVTRSWPDGRLEVQAEQAEATVA